MDDSNRPQSKPGSTTEQLRRDIDSGRTSEKVPVIDPAAAPLGTDDEAAGTPAQPQATERARAYELGDRSAPGDGAASERPLHPTSLLVVGVIVVVAVLVVLAIVLGGN